MPAAKYALYGRLSNRFFPVQMKRGKYVEPQGAPAYYVRFTDAEGKRRYKPLGTIFGDACRGIANMELAKEYIRRGIQPPEEMAKLEDSLSGRVTEYLEEKKNEKSRKTWQAYSNSLKLFQDSCKRTHIPEITRHDLLAFKTFLRDKEELSPRSVYNNFLNVMIFLKACGAKFDSPITKGDWPDKTEREPEEYTDEELLAMLDAAGNEDRLMLRCFLFSGVRSSELAHLTYGDIDFKHSVWTIRPKNGWKVKTGNSQRDVPVPPKLTATIRERMQAGSKSKDDLVFTNRKGKPNLHMLRITKRIAEAAKVTGRVDDHKFRSTAITRWLREGNSVQDVMKWVGHKDLSTILRYAAKVNVRTAETQRKASSAFTKFASVGGD